MSEAEKQPYVAAADRQQQEHKKMYPEYRYQPQHRDTGKSHPMNKANLKPLVQRRLRFPSRKLALPTAVSLAHVLVQTQPLGPIPQSPACSFSLSDALSPAPGQPSNELPPSGINYSFSDSSYLCVMPGAPAAGESLFDSELLGLPLVDAMLSHDDIMPQLQLPDLDLTFLSGLDLPTV